MRKFWRYGFGTAKKLLFGSECTDKIASTATQIARVVSLTLGPMGRNVVIENRDGEPRITKDGVTVAKHIEYEDRLQDAICTLIKQSVNSTNKFAGDGTTTSSLLIGEIIKQGKKSLQCGQNIRQIKEGLVKGRDIGIQFIRTVAQNIQNKEDYKKVAMIATKQDEKLSDLISEAMCKSNSIKVQMTQHVDSHVQYFTGVKMVAGIPHPEFKNRGDKVELDYPLVLIAKKGIKSIGQIVKALQLAKKARKQLLIVSSSISDSVMSTLIYNRRKNIVEVFPLLINQYGTIPEQYYRQLSATTSAPIFDQYGPCDLRDLTFQHLGKAVRVQMDDLETSVIGQTKQECTSAVIYAGGATQAIAMQIYDKLVDALNSVQTAKKHGVVPGGGITYWRLADLLDQYQGPGKVGVRLLGKALRSPRRKLVQALPESYLALGGTQWQAYDFKTKKLRDMREAGILDSAMVGQSVLVDSVSLSCLLLDVSTCIVRISKNTERYKDIQAIERNTKI